MLKPITFTVALSTVIVSSASFAHVKNGALVDGNNKAVSSSYEKCVRVGSGKFFSKCQEIKPRVVATEPAPAPVPVAAPPAPKPEPVAVQEKIEQSISLAGDALFASNSAELTDQGKSSVDPVATGVADLSDYKLSLYGHADSRGNDDYNQVLSERRAQAVANYLISKGVPASSISVYGRGETEPVASNATAEGRAKNRRVDVTVSGMKTTYKTVYK